MIKREGAFRRQAFLIKIDNKWRQRIQETILNIGGRRLKLLKGRTERGIKNVKKSEKVIDEKVEIDLKQKESD